MGRATSPSVRFLKSPTTPTISTVRVSGKPTPTRRPTACRRSGQKRRTNASFTSATSTAPERSDASNSRPFDDRHSKRSEGAGAGGPEVDERKLVRRRTVVPGQAESGEPNAQRQRDRLNPPRGLDVR